MQVVPWRKGQANRNAIINAVKVLGDCYPRQIIDYIYNTIRQKSRWLGVLDEKEIERRVLHERLKERTLFNWLKNLTKQGIFKHSNNRYSLTDLAKSDERYFPELVGDSIISQLMLVHRPTLYPLKHNIKQLVESFGFYTLWCFIQAARFIDNPSLSAKNKDDIIINWLSKVINPLNTFEYFLAAINNQEYDETKIKSDAKMYLNLSSRYRRGLIPIAQLSIPSTDYFYVKELDLRSREKQDYPMKARYELPDETLDNIIDILARVYPVYSKIMRSGLMPIPFNPKEKFMTDVN